MNWKVWLKGLTVAAVGGAVTGAAQAINASGHITTGTAVVAGSGALATTLAYLAKSPIVGGILGPVVAILQKALGQTNQPTEQ